MSQFSVITYNIDATEFNMEERLNALLELLESEKANIVVLQECTYLTCEKLQRKMANLKYFYFIPRVLNNFEKCSMIFSKFDIVSKKNVGFGNTIEGELISVKVKITDDYECWIVTSQLSDNIALNKRQVKNLSNALSEISDCDVIFAGDTQIHSYYQNIQHPEDWYDAWYECGDSTNEYTYDYETNVLIPYKFKDRMDRVWYNSSNLQIDSMELLGKKSKVAISSHYGVKVLFTI